jgi:bis(5'-nucleosyl)-tetraphosphatase (symmetrical)
MATYAIGDVQGCFDELTQLLDECQYRKDRDRLWFVGDLVNRGPQSLEVLRSVRELGDRAVTVLGNHDLHLVTQHEGFERKREDDTFGDVLQARDAKELVGWVRTRPMMHVEGGYAMVHAGLLPQWTIEKASKLAREVEVALAARDYRDFLANMYGSTPDQWNESLTGWDRLRVIVNAMTRMRFCTRDGRMDFKAKGTKPPPGYVAWYAARPKNEKDSLLCGHWSALGLKLGERLALLDTGCVWGGALTALRLEDRALYQVPCRGHQAAGGEG